MSVRRQEHRGVVTLTLDRPDARNALNAAMIGALRAGFDDAEASTQTRAVVLRAAGTTFSAGGDFDAFRSLIATAAPGAGPDPIVAFNRAFGALLERLSSLSAPTIAVVSGSALGGGVGLVAACDFAFATAGAVFRLPEVTLGLPPAQVAPFIADRIGSGPALRRMLTGETIAATEALRIGLIDELAADAAELETIVRRTLGALGRAEPGAVRATKRIVLHDRTARRSATLDFAAERFAEALRSGTAGEGIAALRERREPSWCDALGDEAANRG